MEGLISSLQLDITLNCSNRSYEQRD